MNQILVTQSTEVERLAEESERNRNRLRSYYIAKQMAAVLAGDRFRIPLKHLHLFYRGRAK